MLPKLFLLPLITLLNYGFAFRINIECNNPIVMGATQNCTAKIYNDYDDNLVDGNYRFTWRDDAIPNHTKERSGGNIDTFNVSYNSVTEYPPGLYVIRVEVCHLKLFGVICNENDSKGFAFQITETLNGNLQLLQKNKTSSKFISTADELQTIVDLKKSDRDVVAKAPIVLTYWFIDCIYYGFTNNFKFEHNFTEANENHVIEALVMADFTPLPPPTITPITTTTVSTTTLKPNITTKTANAVTTSLKTTLKPPTTLVTKKRTKRNAGINASTETAQSSAASNTIKMWKKKVLVPYNNSFPYVCNSNVMPTNKQHLYGYFSKRLITQAPVSNVSIVGNNWLQQWEVLNLDIKCLGSSPIQACLKYLPGEYNVTGNETCNTYRTLDQCEFPIRRFLQGEAKYTLLIFFKNEVSTKITPVTVTIYKVKQQAQLSVIVVPVAFSLVAVVTIVFGVAYYLQNRSRFIIEVADFDFGQQYTALEYKTFKDRLKDSIMHTFTRDPTSASTSAASTSSDNQIWPPVRKYTTMN